MEPSILSGVVLAVVMIAFMLAPNYLFRVKNYEEVLRRISTWLKPGGKLFVHIFTHRSVPYHFEAKGDDDWMARYFFTGGIMPSDDLLLHCQDDLTVEKHWRVSGRHYQKTADAWLANMDRERARILPMFETLYGPEDARRWFVRWRLFFAACSELFGYDHGQQWWVSHYLFERPRETA